MNHVKAEKEKTISRDEAAAVAKLIVTDIKEYIANNHDAFVEFCEMNYPDAAEVEHKKTEGVDLVYTRVPLDETMKTQGRQGLKALHDKVTL